MPSETELMKVEIRKRLGTVEAELYALETEMDSICEDINTALGECTNARTAAIFGAFLICADDLRDKIETARCDNDF
jgi:hypothetical protein